MVFRELSFSRLECGVHDRLHIYPLCGIFYFPWHRHQIEGTNGFYCLIRKTERYTISNVESQVFTPNNSRPDPGSNPGCPRDKRMSYHWTNCASLMSNSSAQCGRGEQQLWGGGRTAPTSRLGLQPIHVPTPDGCVDIGCEKGRNWINDVHR